MDNYSSQYLYDDLLSSSQFDIKIHSGENISMENNIVTEEGIYTGSMGANPMLNCNSAPSDRSLNTQSPTTQLPQELAEMVTSLLLDASDDFPLSENPQFDIDVAAANFVDNDADLSREVFGAESSAQTRTVTGGNRQGTLFSLPVRLAPRPGYLQVFPEASVQSNNESPVVAAAAVSPLTPSASNFGMSDTSGNHVLNPQTPGDFENQYTFL